LPRVTLRKRLERALRAGQPWVYRDALAPVPAGARLKDGDLVLVAGGDGRPLARGFWDARSPIAVRVLARDGDGEAELTSEAAARALVAARLGAALELRLRAIDRTATDAFRWVHGEADTLPGVHVDLYGAALSLRYDGAGARAFYAATLPDELIAVARRAGIDLRRIVERAARGGDGGARAVFGALPDGELEVRENGLRFGVDLTHGQKGGLFLDQRENRALVRTLAAGKRVLNLFGYTGGFSVYAAAGGARETTTVDVAAPAIAAARRNFARNALPAAEPAARFVAADAFRFLEDAARAGAAYDLIVSDPPSFVPNRQARAAGLAAYRRLHRLCATVAAPGATFCAASCSSHVDRATFIDAVRDGVGAAERRFALRETRGAGVDHPVVAAFPEGDYLKFVVGTL
jgi:23S rRNA (cytosine1962-C5)-methyltransferase